MLSRSFRNRAKSFVIFLVMFHLSISISAEIDNCCFVDRQCSTDQEWTDGYYAYHNGQCAVETEVNNCCFVGWQCATDEEWTNGYWAYQNNQCGMPTGSQSQSQSRGIATEEVNNCCFIGWQCDADEEWRGGYYAFQQDQCDVSQSHWQAQWRRRQPKTASVVEYESGKFRYTYESGDTLDIWHHTWDEFCELVEDKHPTCTPGYGNNHPVRIETIKA